ncbi:MAG: hypothetical protein JXR70_14930 [Spirochaetales bacterium]|nr:hypothetical protein [Spirochaetales bacterium]
MEWKIVYLILGALTLVFGIWNLAQRKGFYLPLVGIFWFCIVLSRFFISDVYHIVIIRGLPVLGDLLFYIGMPALLILAFLTYRNSRG